jgi:hypothetical protein
MPRVRVFITVYQCRTGAFVASVHCHAKGVEAGVAGVREKRRRNLNTRKHPHAFHFIAIFHIIVHHLMNRDGCVMEELSSRRIAVSAMQKRTCKHSVIIRSGHSAHVCVCVRDM